MNRLRNTLRRQRGLTMIEIMVAVAVGLLLTAGAIQIFVSSKQAYRTTDAISRIQENGRYALQFLAKDIRNAAFWGCAQEAEKNSTLNSGGGFDFTAPPLVGTEGASGAPDTITIRGATQNLTVNLKQAMPTVSAALVVNDVGDVEVGDILLVTDCEAADVFQVTNTQTTSSSIVHNSGNTGVSPGNYTQQLSRKYDTSATVYTARERTYSLVTNADGEPALQREVNGNAEILVDGVQDMQITYGIDTDADFTANAYVPADSVANWDDAIAVRIQLLIRGEEDNVLDEPQQYTYNGTTVTAADKRLRQVFTKTVGVRNRME